MKQFNISDLYDEYLEQYDRSVNNQSNISGDTAEPKNEQLSYDEFETVFNENWYDDNSGDPTWTKGKKIADDLAKEDVYGTTARQRQVQAEAAERLLQEQGGETKTLGQIKREMLGGNDFGLGEAIRNRNNQLKMEGKDSYARKKQISQEFFGSD